MTETSQYRWNASKPAEVAFENEDTMSERSVDILLRYNSDFDYDRLIVAVTTVTPDGYNWCDTIGIPAAKEKLYNNRYTDVEQSYRPGIRFRQQGRYLFRFVPVMPEPDVEGIAAIGVNIH